MGIVKFLKNLQKRDLLKIVKAVEYQNNFQVKEQSTPSALTQPSS